MNVAYQLGDRVIDDVNSGANVVILEHNSATWGIIAESSTTHWISKETISSTEPCTGHNKDKTCKNFWRVNSSSQNSDLASSFSVPRRSDKVNQLTARKRCG